MSELKLCSYCKSVPQANTWTLHGITETRYFCPNPDCPHSVRTVRLEQWNTRPIEDDLRKRIAELEGMVERLIEAGNWLNAMHEDGVFVDELNAARTSWKLAVSDWQSMPSHVTNPLESQGIVTRNGGEG